MQPAENLDVDRVSDELEPHEFSGPLEWYWHFSQRGDFEADSEQLKVLGELERLFGELEEYRQYRAGKINRLVTNLGAGKKPPRGMYIWGGVGRGKSLLMDAFFKVSRHRRKRRVHFHEFMREIHARMRALSGQEDPLDAISTEIARELRLLAFDEFHVSDIADAMILARLMELLIEKGVVLVMTSNYRPDDLYPNGLQRARFLPAIEILKRDLDVVPLGGAVDHRRRLLASLGVYYTPPGEGSQGSPTSWGDCEIQLARFFEAMTKATFSEDGTIPVGGREIAYRRRSKGVIWFDFAELFEKPRSQVDFLEIASAYHTVLVSGVRRMLASQSDVVRRFTWLVDVFYDQRVKLVLSAQAPPEDLVEGSEASSPPERMVVKEFKRTASRLREMQSKDY
ncbi:MAG TPA: cell division protein ZapE, partial [Usitatibacter sp.]|nr:cell division protein ZapE [Usitatibacter sp.]